MQKRKKNKFSLIKVIIICLILVLLSGVGVMAVSTKINTVKIELSNGYEMTVLTTKENVKEILDENNIILENNERVSPNIDEKISENKTIKITDKSKQEVEVAKVSESGVETTLDSLLEAYTTITEKIEKIEGKKVVTYKVKYQNETEIERTKISEEVVQEPVDKIVQVSTKKVSSRSEPTSRVSSSASESSSSSSSVRVYKVTAYCSCSKCCGSHSNGYTASGTKATAGRTVAAPSNLPYGTKLDINGKTYVVEDRGGAIKGNRIDIYVNSHSEALAWGVRYLPVEVQN